MKTAKDFASCDMGLTDKDLKKYIRYKKVKYKDVMSYLSNITVTINDDGVIVFYTHDCEKAVNYYKGIR